MLEKALIETIENLDKAVNSNPTTENIEQLDNAKLRLETINATKTNGSIIRSHAQWIEFGEKNSKYFLNLEKRNYKTKNITSLQIKENQFTHNPKEILNMQKHFYESLYNSSKRCDYFDDIFLNDLPQITENHFRLTEKPLLIEELDRALKAMKPGKTPGTDGLSVEFYQFFWNDIKEIVFDSIKNAYENNKMSEDQRRAVLRLIPKKDKDMTDLKNQRPISLLNTDYEILAQSLAMRLQKVLPEIISKDQNGYLKGRFIGFNIRTILDIIEYSNENKMNSIIAFLDFEKVFDKLDWDFNSKCLQALVHIFKNG